MTEEPTVGEQIRSARVAMGLGLRELARRINMAPSYLSDIEYDRRTPSEDVLRMLCAELGLDVERVMGRAGRLGSTTDEYFRREPESRVLLRTVEQHGFTEDDLKKLIEHAISMARNRKKGPRE